MLLIAPTQVGKLLMLVLLFFVTGTGVSGSSTYSPFVLTHYFEQPTNSQKLNLIWPAASHQHMSSGSSSLLTLMVNEAIVQSNEYWLTQAAFMNHLDAQLELARRTSKESIKKFWWLQAAQSGHSASYFELALIENDFELRISYLERAASAKYQPAVIALSQYWYDTGNQQKAIKWLSKAAHYDPLSEYYLGRLLWKQGHYEQANIHFTSAGKSIDEANDLAMLNKQYSPISLDTWLNKDKQLNPLCAQQLQFVATTLDSAAQAKKFMQKFQDDKRFEQMPICVNNLVWLNKDALSCQLEGHRQRCNLIKVAASMQQQNFTHLVFFLPNGTAYVQHGLMYLDQADTYSVFVHELAHFAGFIDEYAISSELATQYCSNFSAPNFYAGDSLYSSVRFNAWQQDYQVVKNANTKVISKNELQEDDELAVTPSRTCNKVNIQSFKPSSDITFMEHHDTNHIPPLYLQLWKSQLSNAYGVVAVAEALHQASLDQQNDKAAQYWQSFLP